MYPGFARRVLLPIHEAILGRSTLSILQQLEAIRDPSPEWITEVQRKGLGRILQHAQSQIPYWRERLRLRVDRAKGNDVSALLATVPVLTRAEIRRHREVMRWQSAPGKILMHRSGGTTDDNLSFYWGRTRQSWDRAMRYRGLGRHGIFPGDRILHIWPRYPGRNLTDKLKLGLRDFRDRLTNDEVIDLRPISPDRLDAVLRYCVVYRPVLLIGYPSWLFALSERIRTAHPQFRLPGLRLILCTGEVLFLFQRKQIAEIFGVPVAQEYGSQDAGLIAHEDPAGILRLNSEQMVVEILRDGAPAMPGELGEVVVTHFYTEIMPFIRYATGDVVRQPVPSEGNIPNGLPVFPAPEGRTSDVLSTTAGQPCPMRPVVETLVEQAGLREFSLYQPEANRLLVLVVEATGAADRGLGKVEEILRTFLGRDLMLELRSGKRFEPFTSGKRRFVCSPVGMRLLGHDKESGLSRARAWPQRLEGETLALQGDG
jgi:phenylacetate-CoA ligase